MSLRFAQYPLLLLLALLLTACHDGQQMRQALSDLQARNQADSLLTDDSLALALTQYFDRHGTPNERMEAHYLLGRTYADRGEAPQAIAAYQTAAEQADTTTPDCDYHQLAKVYGQLGNMLFSHKLIPYALQAFEQAGRCAIIIGDTLLSIIAYEQKAKCYYNAGQTDSAEWVIRKVSRQYTAIGDTLASNTAVGPLAYICTQKGLFDEARVYINRYEHHSYVSLDTTAHRDSWHLFQVQKGFYYLGTDSISKAIALFRKEISYQGDTFHRLLVFKGLMKAYEKEGRTDSISKYAQLRTIANDSVVDIQLSQHLQQMMAMFDYNQPEIRR